MAKAANRIDLPKVTFRDGTTLGERIPGSRFVRSICDGCSELIRVTQASACDFCDTCDPRQPTMRTPNVAMTREMAFQRMAMMSMCDRSELTVVGEYE